MIKTKKVHISFVFIMYLELPAGNNSNGPTSAGCYASLSGDSRTEKVVPCLLLETKIWNNVQVSYYGNPHSRTHQYGWESEKAMEVAREQVNTFLAWRLNLTTYHIR